MTYPAHVVSALIASPSDVQAEREALRVAMWDFNDEHTAATEVVLLPIMWERHSTPLLGTDPQTILDEQIVDSSDLVVGIFWTRIGQILSDGTAATVHELERHVESGKPALLYFSNKPAVPSSIDKEQYEAVLEFKERAKSWGIYGEFGTLDEFTQKVKRDLLRTVRDRLNLPQVMAPQPPSLGQARPVAQVRHEQKTRVDSKQRTKISNHTYLTVSNEGTDVARNLRLTWVEGEDGESRPPLMHGMDEPIDYLVPNAAIEFPVLLDFDSGTAGTLRMTWLDESGDHEQLQTIRF